MRATEPESRFNPFAFVHFLECLQQDIGCVIPANLVPRDREWRCLDDWLWQAGNVQLEPFLLQDALTELPNMAPPDHGLIGLWGHGANSYALYVSVKSDDLFIHCRLHFGGAYADIDMQRARIKRFLQVASDQIAAKPAAASLELIQSMEVGQASVIDAQGRREQMTGNFILAPERLLDLYT